MCVVEFELDFERRSFSHRQGPVLRNKSIPVLIARFMAAMLGDQLPQSERKVRSRERLGGLLRL